MPPRPGDAILPVDEISLECRATLRLDDVLCSLNAGLYGAHARVIFSRPPNELLHE